jgi:FkbM family methyltransferase
MEETLLDGYRVFLNNFQEYREIVMEVFENSEYHFLSSKLSPLIIDCGSHIGISVLYFKKLYPQARIIAFEPNPDNFNVLQKNIEVNDLKNITAINAALSSCQGDAFLFGEFGDNTSRSCGNSLMQEWANPGSKKIKVKTEMLSHFILEKIDFLKMDIEGEENNVLTEIHNKLNLIQEMRIELHSVGLTNKNNIDTVVNLLTKNNFMVEIKPKLLKDYFPVHVLDWAIHSGLNLASISAKNRVYYGG